ncbi:glycoside hydrolase family 2 domain protein [Phocaeicola vulgatus str. 3775 SL(B) 10 (iv)]|uniref:Glycoside hydrolase family 2 domain protein n=1 Tax=Phocaeicola vulgatus str. 3775 SL(B) 10 (iv) TaxID=1339350 RepID=A0A078RE89_PHOVU|nr:glycoside hydrolase family 2 domain protein [Phocaeicola vulgatus str. 3775 SL(B) 10 (iv)]
MMISERRVFFLQFIWYKIIFRPSSFEKKDQKYEIIWIVTVRMDDGILTGPTDT